MSRYFNSFMDNSSEALEHSWGTSPEAKAREKEYNHWYYQKHKDDIAAVRKQRYASMNSYRQAQKSREDARRYADLSNKMYDKYTDIMYSGHAKSSDIDMLDKAQQRYMKMYQESESKSRKYKIQGDELNALANYGARSLINGIKNPTVRDLVEFYLDTTVEKAKKSASKAANKAKKYATKAVSNAEKAAEKYVTKTASNAEKAYNKAEKYANKAVKSVANKAKKYVVR